MRKRFVYLSALLALFLFSSFCDQEQSCKTTIVKKVSVARPEFSQPLEITNFFLFN
jgi:hypothetical protein